MCICIRRRTLLFYHADIKGKYLLQQRMEVVRARLEAEEMERPDEGGTTVITTMDAFLDGMPPLRESCRKRRLDVESGRGHWIS